MMAAYAILSLLVLQQVACFNSQTAVPGTDSHCSTLSCLNSRFLKVECTPAFVTGPGLGILLVHAAVPVACHTECQLQISAKACDIIHDSQSDSSQADSAGIGLKCTEDIMANGSAVLVDGTNVADLSQVTRTSDAARIYVEIKCHGMSSEGMETPEQLIGCAATQQSQLQCIDVMPRGKGLGHEPEAMPESEDPDGSDDSFLQTEWLELWAEVQEVRITGLEGRQLEDILASDAETAAVQDALQPGGDSLAGGSMCQRPQRSRGVVLGRIFLGVWLLMVWLARAALMMSPAVCWKLNECLSLLGKRMAL